MPSRAKYILHIPFGAFQETPPRTFKEEPIDNTEQDENDGEPIQKKRKIENQMIDYQNTIPTLELIQAMFFKIHLIC